MKINITLEFDDVDRRALNARVGEPGKASRAQLEGFIRMAVDASVQSAVDEFAARLVGKEPPAARCFRCGGSGVIVRNNEPFGHCTCEAGRKLGS